MRGLSVDIPFALDYYCQTELFECFIGPYYGRVVMVEKTLIAIIALIFLISSWWWSDRQNATENFYEDPVA